MIQIELNSQSDAPNDEVQSSEVELELLRMAITDEDLNAICFNEADLESMFPSIEEVIAMTDADWARLRFSQNDLALLREDLMCRLGVSAHNLPWLSRALEREQHGHKRAKTGTN